MYTFFLVCAVIGGTVMVLQLALSLLGVGLDIAGDVGGDFAGHVGGDVGGHAGGHVAGDAAHAGDTSDHYVHHKAWHLGKFFTLQAIVAFFAFFGLGGLGSMQKGTEGPFAVFIAMAVGIGAMVLVGYVFGSINKLESDGTIRLRRSVGCPGRVYLRIPGEGSGIGKVTVTFQQQTLEVKARTPGPELSTGSSVVVTKLLERDTVEVVAQGSKVDQPVSQSV